MRATLAARLVDWNNRRVREAGGSPPNPRDLDLVTWHSELQSSWPAIVAEWDRFERSGGRLPLLEDIIDEHQGNEGPWRAGLLVSRGVPCPPLAREFPSTLAALADVPGLRSALWSVLDPGTTLGEHEGPNAGVLRYHLGVSCGEGAALRIEGSTIPYRDGEGVLFDDTVTHSAWNHGPSRRVTLFCEIDRRIGPMVDLTNTWVQAVLALDQRYRCAPKRAAEWHAALNRGRERTAADHR